ncbi:phosphodiesterase [Sphingomonas sp. NCPPB 2930]
MTTTTPRPTTFLVQLTDLHIREPGRLAYRRIDTAAYLRATLAAVGRLVQPPDAVVVTGDLTDFGRPAEYAYLRELLAPLPMPVYLMPGNHDDRANLRAGFPDHAYLGTGRFIQYTADIGDLRLVALDSVTPGHGHGTLCEARLDWLEATLEASRGRPVVVALHHPPFATLIGHMDRQGLLEGAARFEAIVARHPNVERIIAGHVHRAVDARFGGTIACTSPAPAHAVFLDLAEDAASQWVLEPAQFRILAQPAAGPLVTHLVSSAETEGPYPFYDNGTLID